MEIAIPKQIYQIWIGDRNPPRTWMETWKNHHPKWSYTIIDNEYLKEQSFKNQHLIAEYIKRREFAGAADLIRYEILYENGGFMPEADSICLKNTDELWTQKTAYTVFENEIVRGDFVSPILASDKQNVFVGSLISELNKLKAADLDKAWKTTGNAFVARQLKQTSNDVVIFPSHYFIPKHFTGQTYSGNGPIYAEQLFGETTGGYAQLSLWSRLMRKKGKIRSAYYRKFRK